MYKNIYFSTPYNREKKNNMKNIQLTPTREQLNEV